MKIYFTCSTSELLKYKDNYFAIRDFLVKEDHVLTRDWLPHATDLVLEGKTERKDIKEIYNACIKAIQEAEVVIIEDTVSSFSTGHQITVALQWQKPVLVLWNKRKQVHFKTAFIEGIDSNLLEYSEYTLENVGEIIHKFVKKYENAKQKNRFHLVLDEVERKYLDWAQFNKGESRTKIIRDSLRKAINSDEGYSKFLRE